MKNFQNPFVKPGNVLLILMSAIISVILLQSTSCKKQESTDNGPDTEPPYLFMKANFMATHNSYSGNKYDGHRGSIIQQLDLGLRFIELDIVHKNGDFEVSHYPGEDRVDHGHGNPASKKLSDWLQVIADWSDANPSHDPIALAFDPKTAPAGTSQWNTFRELLISTFSIQKIVQPNHFHKDSTSLFNVRGKVFFIILPYYVMEHDPSLYAPPDGDTIMFVMRMRGAKQLKDSTTVFYGWDATESGTHHWSDSLRRLNKSARLWKVQKDNIINPAPNYPSTDDPYFGWYVRYCKSNNVFPDFDFATVTWTGEYNHDNGINPDVAVNTAGYVVEVHQSQNNYNELWYNTGKLSPDGKSIQWFSVSTSSRNYDTGENPSVAITDGNIVVEVHGSENNSDLYYRTGTLDISNGVINWLQHKKHDIGETPSVAINTDNMVVEVHQAHYSDKLWYNVGTMNTNGTITWGAMEDCRNYTTGHSPSVAIYGNQVFEAHNSSTDYLWCRIGQADNAQLLIHWKDTHGNATYFYPFEESTSIVPSVALNANGALEVHRSMESGIWWRPGKFSNTVMALGASEKIHSTTISPFSSLKISVAINGEQAVLLYVNDSDDLCYRLGTIQ
ncbi:MAG: hypothetical protein V1733_01195 [bacterium]